ncbi:MAG: sporulation protein YjcZ [Bacilli bacterium]|nr:sporulation protein YjcZ [Bacilli bacterium]
MYYYGGYQGYGGGQCGCNPCGGYPGYGYGTGYGAAIILVLFILLVIIIGARNWDRN